jgi:protein-disulfide isomerase
VRRRLSFLALLGLAVLAAVFGYVAMQRYVHVLRSEQAVAVHADEVFRSPSSAIAGNPQGDVSVVVFFDYNCPYCRKDGPALARLIERDGQIRLVLKELPVLGADSEAAARLALAAKRQSKYYPLYERLMAAPGRINEERALAEAKALGLDRARLEVEMNDPEIGDTLLANTRLARDLGVRGVPFYLVGDRVIPGGQGDLYKALERGIADVRENGCRAAC